MKSDRILQRVYIREIVMYRTQYLMYCVQFNLL